MANLFDLPSNIFISTHRNYEKRKFIKFLTTQMDYSDIWICHNPECTQTKYPNNFNPIQDLLVFVNQILEKKYVSDCLMVIIDDPTIKMQYVYKLLKNAHRLDIIVILLDYPKIKKNKKLYNLVDYECVFKSNKKKCAPKCSTCSDMNMWLLFSAMYEQLKWFEFLCFNRNTNDIKKLEANIKIQ